MGGGINPFSAASDEMLGYDVKPALGGVMHASVFGNVTKPADSVTRAPGFLDDKTMLGDDKTMLSGMRLTGGDCKPVGNVTL